MFGNGVVHKNQSIHGYVITKKNSGTSILPLYALMKFPENVEGAVKYHTADFVSVPESPEESDIGLNLTGVVSKRVRVQPAGSPSLNPPCIGPI